MIDSLLNFVKSTLFFLRIRLCFFKGSALLFQESDFAFSKIRLSFSRIRLSGLVLFLLQECSDLVELPFPGLGDALGPLEYGLHCLLPWDLGSELLWGSGRLTAVGWGVRAHRV